MIDRIQRFFKRIEICWAYLKQGWNSYDWDYDYLLDDIEFKLKRMRDCFENCRVSEDDLKTVKQIREALENLKVWREPEEYGNVQYRATMQAKWGKWERWHCETDGKYRKTMMKYAKENYKNHDKVQKDNSKLIMEEVKEAEDCKKRFFRILSKNVEGWWN